MISTLYRGKNTRIIKVNPFHDDTSADEKYRVFRDGAIVERINFRDRIVRNVKKKHAVPSVDKLILKQKKLHVLRDIQYSIKNVF